MNAVTEVGAPVDVGGPHVERHGGDLEEEPHAEQATPARSRPVSALALALAAEMARRLVVPVAP